MKLADFKNPEFDRGAPAWKEALWVVAGDPLLRSMFTSSGIKASILRLFGARIGAGCRIKNDVRIKFPWKLAVGDNVWIGQSVWIDNLEPVTIGSDVCVSQGVFLCTGNHDWADPAFKLICRPITIQDKAWIGAQSRMGPGAAAGEGAVLTLGSTALTELEPWTVYQGNPAVKARERRLRPGTDPRTGTA